MCGIVGYVGDQQAVDVVIEGCAGWSTAATTRRASRSSPTARWHRRKRAGKLGNLEKLLAAEPPLRGDVGMGHTRWATHGAPTDRNAHPHLDSPARVAVIHNGIIENFADAAGRPRARAATSCAPTPTPRWSPTCSPRSTSRAGRDLRRGMRRVCRALRRRVHAASPCTPATPAPWSAPAATPRWWSVSATARTSSAATSRRSSRTPAARSSSGQDQVVELRADSGARHPVRRRRRPRCTEYHVDWDAAAAEKGGYDYFMLKEIAEQPRAVADTLLGRRRPGRAARPGRDAAVRRRAARGRQDRRSSPAAPRTTPGCSPSTRSSTGPGSRARSSWPASSATATRS